MRKNNHYLIPTLLLTALAGAGLVHVREAAAAPAQNAQSTPAVAPPAPAGNSEAKSNEAKSNKADVDEQIFTDFKVWSKSYAKALGPAEKTALEAEGLALAVRRSEAMLRLIAFDPKRALLLAAPPRARQELPTAIAAHVEVHLSGRGEFAVIVIDDIDPQTKLWKSRVKRSIVLGGKSYHASVYGRRLGVTTKKRMAAHGIVLGRYMAIHESPVRRLAPDAAIPPEMPIGNPDKLCPICGADAARGLAVDVGGVLYYLDTEEDIKKFAARIEAQEDIIDPDATGL